MDFYKAQVKAVSKAKAREILKKMQAQGIEEMHLPAIPRREIGSFLIDERPNLWTIEVDGVPCFEVISNKIAASAMLRMLDECGQDKINLAPLCPQFLEDFLADKRKDVMAFEIAHTDPGEELPGHV